MTKEKILNSYKTIIELHINRRLTQKECVHHIDGNHENNVLENLQLCSDSASHHAFHLVMNKRLDLYNTIMGL